MDNGVGIGDLLAVMNARDNNDGLSSYSSSLRFSLLVMDSSVEGIVIL